MPFFLYNPVSVLFKGAFHHETKGSFQNITDPENPKPCGGSMIFGVIRLSG